MSDAELSDINDDEDIVRRYENNDADGEGQEMEQDGYVSDGEVRAAEGDDDEAKKVEPPKKKRTVNKRFVLNTERLKGPKGVHTIEKLFEGFKFHGKGHEKDDLDRVMKRLEYWAFRLFPKLDFDDFLDKCENLGHKKDLQTHLKRYRLDMISADEIVRPEFIEEEAGDDEGNNEPEIQRTENQTRPEVTTEIQDDEFQRLFDEMEQQQQEPEQAMQNTQQQQEPKQTVQDVEFQRLLIETEQQQKQPEKTVENTQQQQELEQTVENTQQQQESEQTVENTQQQQESEQTVENIQQQQESEKTVENTQQQQEPEKNAENM